MQNIQFISDNAICTACGACIGVCPMKAIEICSNHAGYLLARVHKERCVECKICLEICPSNMQHLPYSDEEVFYGNRISSYIGYAKDPLIRQNSQSGGVVTALLCYMLEHNIIEGAVVNQFDSKINRPMAVFAKTKKEIISGCGSYYTQSPVVKTIWDHRDKNIGVVALGCQVEGLRLLKERYPETNLSKCTIGLFCAGQNSGRMIDDLIRKTKCDTKNEIISQFHFRDKNINGWPGEFHIITNSEKSYFLPKEKRHQLKPIHECHRCIACYDKMNIYSDIACGDPWGIMSKEKQKGYTILIVRTENGRRIIEQAERDGIISIESLSDKAIFKGQAIDSEIVKRFYTVSRFFEKNQWLYPYCINQKQTSISASRKYRSNIEKRLLYTRCLYLAKNNRQVIRMQASKKLKQVIKRNNVIKLPLRYLRKQIKWNC